LKRTNHNGKEAERGIELALEPERVSDSQPDQKVEELPVEELQADHDQDYEHDPAEGNSKLERHVKLTLVAAACFVIIYAGMVWYDKHEQVARELEIVPPPPTVITGSGLFDVDKSSSSNSAIGKSSQQVSLQSIN
jgi:hypothetical protein